MARPKEATVSSEADKHVSSMIRRRRTELGLSMAELAEKLNLSYQQVQKYENGSNRLSVARLLQFASTLRVPPDWFFEGLPPTLPIEFIASKGLKEQTIGAARAFADIDEPELRDNILAIVRRAKVRPVL